MWKLQTYTGPTVVALCGVGLSIAVFAIILNVQQSQVEKEFEKSTNERHEQLQRALTHGEEHLRHLKYFFISSKHVTNGEFQRYTGSFVNENEGIAWRGIYWIPSVRPGRTGSISDGLDISSTRTISSGSGRPAMYPVLYRREVQVDRLPRGRNVLDDSRLRSLLKRGVESGAVQGTKPVKRTVDGVQTRHLWIITPVFEQPGSRDRGQLRGFVGAWLNLDRTFEPYLSGPGNELIIDQEPFERVSRSESPPENRGIEPGGWKGRIRQQLYGTFRTSKKLLFANQSWTVRYAPRPDFFRILDIWRPAVAGGMVLLLTGLLVGYLLVLNSREEVIRATVQERTRELKKAKQREEKANRAKSEFLAKMSHEIRTPLNALMGMNELLLKSSLTPDQKEYVNISQQSAETLLNLLDDILDLSKAEAGKIELNRQPIELERFVQDTVSYFARQAYEKGIDLHVFVEGSCPAVIVEDRLRLKQILVNLVSNAVKFTDEGEVVVRVLSGEREASVRWLEFRVVDTGIGIAPEKCEHLFEKFTQVTSEGTRDTEGTGLGLSICKSLVERMGGEISVESEKGRGSTFSFRIPAQLPENGQSDLTVSERASEDLPPAFYELHVLLVDSSSTNRLILRRMFAQWDARVVEARDGEELVSALREANEQGDPYDLVLLDHELKKSEETEPVRQLNEFVDSDRIILMLRPGEVHDAVEGEPSVDVGGYITKPVDWSNCVETVRDILTPEENGPRSTGGEDEERNESELEDPCSILVAEDNAQNRKLVEAMLDPHPIDVDFAKDGEEALERARSGNHDLIFMDVRMPDMNGLEVTEAYRKWEEQQGRQRVPIVALTARALPEHRRESEEAGCDAHLTKPIREQKLVSTIQRFVFSEAPSDKETATDGEGKFGEANEDAGPVGDDMLRDLVPELLEDLRDKVHGIQQRVDEQDYEAVNDIAHDIKGAAANFGFREISEKARRIEVLSEEKEKPQRIFTLAGEILSLVDSFSENDE